MKTRDFFQLLREAFYQWWFEDNIFQHGAALAYYALFSLSPLVVIAVFISGQAFGEEAARGELADQIEKIVGTTIAEAIQDTIKRAHLSGSGPRAMILSLLLLALGAMGVFRQLQTTLNFIWGVQLRPQGFLGMVRGRFWSFLMVLCVGSLLLVGLLVSSSLAYVARLLDLPALPGGLVSLRALNWLGSLVLLTLLFATVFKVLPDVKIAWRVVWTGSIVTALLFTLGNYLIGLYLAYSTPASAFGAAGSLVMVLGWVYYSSQVVLFGAELTEAYAEHFGVPIVPAKNAMRLKEELTPPAS